jgi:flagellin-like hook-associated protein FlgL
MKKNVMMRLACFLLVAVLISTSAISGTYAKYVTKDTAMDSARVAKWGVQIDAAGTTFAEAYDAKAEGNDPAADKTSTAVTVRSDLTHGSINNLVAPGTNGKMAEIGVSKNRLESALSANEVTQINITAAHSNIVDADIAQESMELLKAQILQNASASLLVTIRDMNSNSLLNIYNSLNNLRS